MDLENIFADVVEVIEVSTGIPKDTISKEDTLFDKLGVDSIDLVDILFELETKYDVELKVSDIESRAKVELGDVPYEIDGILTTEGLAAIRTYMPEIESDKLVEGLSVHGLIQLFSVHSLCNIVQYRMDQKEE